MYCSAHLRFLAAISLGLISTQAFGATTTISTPQTTQFSFAASGDELLITSDGSITINNNAIFAGNGINANIVRMFGTISTSGNGDDGINLNADADILVDGTITTLGNNSEGILTTSNANIRFGGAITTSGNGSEGIQTTAGSTINISASGTITTSGNNSEGIIASGAGNNVRNAGHISTSGNSQAEGIRAGAGAFVENRGSITTTGTNTGGAINSPHGIRVAGNGIIVNSGRIATSGANADGIFTGQNASVTNSGSISATDTSSNGIDLHRNSQVTNTGNIVAGDIGIFFSRGGNSGSDSRVTNSGRIESLQGPAGTAIQFRQNGSADTLTLQAGSRIIGRMDMGNQGGNDTIILDRTGGDIAWRWTFEDFDDTINDTLTVIGGPFIVERPGDSLSNGITVTVADTSLQTSAGGALADLAGSQMRLTLNRISEAWALSDAPASEDGDAPDLNAWVRTYGGLRYREGQSNPSGDSVDSQNTWFGLAAGADMAIGARSFVGAYISQTHSRTAFAGTTQVVRADTTTGGLYGRFESMGGLFADASLIAGYVNGDGGTRERANNLVAGGIEEISGGDLSGPYIAPTIRLGANIRLTESFSLVPSATLGYAAQWRDGYEESGAVGAFQTADDQLVETGTVRFELAANITRDTAHARFFGGIHMQQDLSGKTDITLESTSIGSTNFTIDPAANGLEVGGFAGMAFHWAMSERWALNLDAEASLAQLPESFDSDILDEVGFDASAGLRVRF